MRFTCCPNLHCSSFLMDFQTGHFADFKQFGHFANSEQFKIDCHFSNFSQVTIDLSLLLWSGYGCFTSLGKTLGREKLSKVSLLDNIFKKTDLSQAILNDSISGNQELTSKEFKGSIFHFCNTLSDLCDKIK